MSKFTSSTYRENVYRVHTGWRRLIGCLKLQVIFRKRATNYGALLRKMTYQDKTSYGAQHPVRQWNGLLMECIELAAAVIVWHISANQPRIVGLFCGKWRMNTGLGHPWWRYGGVYYTCCCCHCMAYFCESATEHRALLRKMTYENGSWAPCTTIWRIILYCCCCCHGMVIWYIATFIEYMI